MRKPWDFNDKCPYCGHRAALHSSPPDPDHDGDSPTAPDYRPGACHERRSLAPGGPRVPCSCPGWHPDLEPEQLDLVTT